LEILAILDRLCLPLSLCRNVAYHDEVTLAQLSFNVYLREAKREYLLGDRLNASVGLNNNFGPAVVAPYRSTWKLKIQDPLEGLRYQRRCLVEHFFAWL
jgi:hypothetical protein